MFWVIAQRLVIVSYRCFGTTFRYHLQGSGVLNPYSPHNNPEGRSSHLLRSRNPEITRETVRRQRLFDNGVQMKKFGPEGKEFTG